MPKVVKAPALGQLIDILYVKRATRIEQQRQVDALKVKERELKEQIMQLLDIQKSLGSKGTLATAAIIEEVEPVPENWDKTYAYIKKYDAFHLLHQRIAVRAWREIHDAGKKVPGIGSIITRDLSLTKSSKA